MKISQQKRSPLSRLLATFLLVPLLLQSACGTLLYPERRGQTGTRIDPSVVILNGIGLLIFLIPGLIAFAVDFSTGAIYLPPDETGTEGEDRVIYLDPDSITPESLAAAIREHTGKEVTFTEHDLRVLEKQSPESIGADLSALNRLN